MIHAVLLATRTGHVIYERFYCTLTEPEKAELRAACDQAGPRTASDNQECVGRFRNGRIVMIPSGNVLFYALGSGEYNELALAEVLRALILAITDLLRAGALSDTVLFQNYAVLAIIIDSIIKQGHVELLDRASIQKSISFKLTTPKPAVPEPQGMESKARAALARIPTLTR